MILCTEYECHVTSIITRVEPMSLEEVYEQLLSHELRLEQHYSAIELSVLVANAAEKHYSTNF